MANSIQTNNSSQQWHNQAFADLFDSITAKLPSMTFWAILFSYGATAALNVWAIHLPLYISVPLSIAIQGLRFLTVFTPFLNPHGRASHLPEVIALGASVLALFELSFSLQALGEKDASFWSLFLFGAAILVLSMILELQFINQGKKAFGLTGGQKVNAGAVSTTNAQNQSNAPLPQAVQDHIEFVMDQNKQLQKRLETPLIDIDDRTFMEEVKRRNDLFKKERDQGNGQAPTRPKQSTANMGHSANGMNGHTLNHQNP